MRAAFGLFLALCLVACMSSTEALRSPAAPDQEKTIAEWGFREALNHVKKACGYALDAKRKQFPVGDGRWMERCLTEGLLPDPLPPVNMSTTGEEDFKGARAHLAKACEFWRRPGVTHAPTVSQSTWQARCEEDAGRLATARKHYRDAIDRNAVLPSSPTTVARAERLEEELAALEPRIPTLTLIVNNRPTGLEVFLDGTPVVEHLGVELPVDLGEHIVEAGAPGYVSFEGKIESRREGVPQQFTIPLERDNNAGRRSPGQPMIGWSLVAVGLAAMAGSGALYIDAVEKHDQAKDHCRLICDSIARPLQDGALESLHKSWVLGLAGALVTAGGTILVMTSPSAPKSTPGMTFAPIVTLRTDRIEGGFSW